MSSISRSTLRLAQPKWTCPSCRTMLIFQSVRENTSSFEHLARIARPSLSKSTLRHSSTSAADSDLPPPPPMLSKLKADLKTAMRSKDKPRLNVLRSLISDINNSTKTTSPITADIQILALLRKKRASSEEAISEALGQKREDIADKQRTELKVVDEYASSVAVLSESEITQLLTQVVQDLKESVKDEKNKAGPILRTIFQTGGVLEGKNVEKSTVVKVVNELLGRS